MSHARLSFNQQVKTASADKQRRSARSAESHCLFLPLLRGRARAQPRATVFSSPLFEAGPMLSSPGPVLSSPGPVLSLPPMRGCTLSVPAVQTPLIQAGDFPPVCSLRLARQGRRAASASLDASPPSGEPSRRRCGSSRGPGGRRGEAGEGDGPTAAPR